MTEPAAAGMPGQVGWNALLTPVREQAFAFYAALFGWRKAEALESGPMGTIQTFGLGEAAFGGMRDQPAAVPRPFWLYSLTVEDIDAAAARVAAAGGQVQMGPMAVPGGGWSLQALDPQGAAFALLGPRLQK
ncbi:VOC family protein [Paeniroseomonas aquatica]